MSGKQLVGCVGFGETRQIAHQCAVGGALLSRNDQNMTRSMAVDMQFL